MNLWLVGALSGRQVVSRYQSGFVRFVGILSIAGIAIGVAALIVLRSFMDGFMGAIRTSLDTVNPPVYVFSPGGGRLGPADLGLVEELASTLSETTGAVAILERPAVASGAAGTVAGVMVRGRSDKGDGAVLGIRLAEALGVSGGDTIRVASTAGATVSGMGRILVDTIMPLAVVSVRDFGIDEYNRSLVSVSIGTARTLFREEQTISAIGVNLREGSDPVPVSAALDSLLRRSYVDEGWPVYISAIPFMAFHSNLFQALGLETLAMTIVLALITVVALLNLSSALFMIALEHRWDTGVLRAMGASPATVFVTSITRGLSMGVAGVLSGVALALLAVWGVNRFFPIRLDASVYWVENLSGRFSVETAIAVSMATIIVCLIVSVAPALSSLSDSPAKALRYE